MSTEQTFSEINDINELMDKCRELCTILAKDLENESLMVCSVFIKIYFSDFFKLRTHANIFINNGFEFNKVDAINFFRVKL